MTGLRWMVKGHLGTPLGQLSASPCQNLSHQCCPVARQCLCCVACVPKQPAEAMPIPAVHLGTKRLRNILQVPPPSAETASPDSIGIFENSTIEKSARTVCSSVLSTTIRCERVRSTPQVRDRLGNHLKDVSAPNRTVGSVLLNHLPPKPLSQRCESDTL